MAATASASAAVAGRTSSAATDSGRPAPPRAPLARRRDGSAVRVRVGPLRGAGGLAPAPLAAGGGAGRPVRGRRAGERGGRRQGRNGRRRRGPRPASAGARALGGEGG